MLYWVGIDQPMKMRGTSRAVDKKLQVNNYQDPNVTTGGRALAFYASQRIKMAKHKIQAADPIKEEEGIKVNCKVAKNRFAKGNPYTTTNYYAIFGLGIDTALELPDILERSGIVRKSGSWYYFEDAKGKPIVIDGVEMKFGSKTKFVEFLKKNPKAQSVLQAELDKTEIKAISLSIEEIDEIKAAEDAVNASEAAVAMEGEGNPIDDLV